MKNEGMRRCLLGFVMTGAIMMCVLGCSGRRPPGTVRVKCNGQVVYVDKNPYEVLSADEYAELCRQNRKLKKVDNEEKMTRCIVRPTITHP